MIAKTSVSTRRAYITLFFATFLVAYGLALIAMHGFASSTDYTLLPFAVTMTAVGILGVVAAITKDRQLVIILMNCLLGLAVITFQAVYYKLSAKKKACPELASHFEAHKDSIFLETLPGMFVEVSSQIHFTLTVDMKTLGECEKRVHTMWIYAICILVDILISLQVCLWRFLSAIKDEEKAAAQLALDEEEEEEEEELLSVKEDPPMPPQRPVYFL